jgi:hypothetical protein
MKNGEEVWLEEEARTLIFFQVAGQIVLIGAITFAH